METFKTLNRGSNITDMAMYYYSLGEDNYRKEDEEYIYTLIQSGRLTEEEVQDCWEVIVHYSEKVYGRVFNSVRYRKEGTLKNQKLVREWSLPLKVFNQVILEDRWIRGNGIGSKDEWVNFKTFYEFYKEFTGRKQRLILTNEDYRGIIGKNKLYAFGKYMRSKKLSIKDVKEGRIPEGKEFAYLDDVLDYFEKKYPIIKSRDLDIVEDEDREIAIGFNQFKLLVLYGIQDNIVYEYGR